MGKKNQSSLKKWLIQGLEQRKYNMSLEYYIVSENKEVLTKRWEQVKRI